MSKFKKGEIFYYCSCAWGDYEIHEYICFDYGQYGLLISPISLEYEYEYCFETLEEAQAYQQKNLKEEIEDAEKDMISVCRAYDAASLRLTLLKEKLIK
jgi:hypothetical protein